MGGTGERKERVVKYIAQQKCALVKVQGIALPLHGGSLSTPVGLPKLWGLLCIHLDTVSTNKHFNNEGCCTGKIQSSKMTWPSVMPSFRCIVMCSGSG